MVTEEEVLNLHSIGTEGTHYTMRITKRSYELTSGMSDPNH